MFLCLKMNRKYISFIVEALKDRNNAFPNYVKTIADEIFWLDYINYIIFDRGVQHCDTPTTLVIDYYTDSNKKRWKITDLHTNWNSFTAKEKADEIEKLKVEWYRFIKQDGILYFNKWQCML